MSGEFYSLLFLVAAAVVFTLHEMGHYIAAALCGVNVESVIVGFGREVWSRRGSNGNIMVSPPAPDLWTRSFEAGFRDRSGGGAAARFIQRPVMAAALCHCGGGAGDEFYSRLYGAGDFFWHRRRAGDADDNHGCRGGVAGGGCWRASGGYGHRNRRATGSKAGRGMERDGKLRRAIAPDAAARRPVRSDDRHAA